MVGEEFKRIFNGIRISNESTLVIINVVPGARFHARRNLSLLDRFPDLGHKSRYYFLLAFIPAPGRNNPLRPSLTRFQHDMQYWKFDWLRVAWLGFVILIH